MKLSPQCPRIFLALACGVLLAPELAGQEAAAPMPGPAVAAQETPPQRVRSEKNRLSRAEIQGEIHTDAYTIIQSLRPQWLQGRGASSFYRPVILQVYQDGMQMGGPDALRRIPRDAIREIRYLDASAATQRFGTDHTAGAILVLTKT